MTDTKVTALTTITSASDDDILYIVDDPAGTPLSRKITKADLKKGTLAEYNTSLTDGDFATLAGTETLTGKTLTGNTAVTLVSGAATLTLPTTTGTLATLANSEALTNKTYNGNTITSGTGTITLGASSTLVTSATNSITLTSTGATNVTLPTTGTLATLAGVETLDGKTLTAVVRVQNALATALGTTGTINLDFSTGELTTMPAMTGNVTFTASNYAAGRSKTIRIIGGASAFTFTFPTTWKFLGAAAPASLAIGKYAVLTLTSISTTEAEVVAAYSAQV